MIHRNNYNIVLLINTCAISLCHLCNCYQLLLVGVIVSERLFPLNGEGDCCVLMSLPVAVRRADEEDCWTQLSLFEYLLLIFLWT